MKLQLFYLVGTLLIGCCILSCSDDEESAPLEGVWQGTSAHAKFYPSGSPVAAYDEALPDFTPIIAFNEDGSASVEVDGTITEGTWEYADGNKKIVTSVDLQNEFFGPSETFTIKTLTSSSLVLEYLKEGDIDIPDVGVLDGKLQLTLNFTRVD